MTIESQNTLFSDVILYCRPTLASGAFLQALLIASDAHLCYSTQNQPNQTMLVNQISGFYEMHIYF